VSDKPKLVLAGNFTADEDVSGRSPYVLLFAGRPYFENGKLVALHIGEISDDLVVDYRFQKRSADGRSWFDLIRTERKTSA
jgi:hypothetical protein